MNEKQRHRWDSRVSAALLVNRALIRGILLGTDKAIVGGLADALESQAKDWMAGTPQQRRALRKELRDTARMLRGQIEEGTNAQNP